MHNPHKRLAQTSNAILGRCPRASLIASHGPQPAVRQTLSALEWVGPVRPGVPRTPIASRPITGDRA